MGVFRPSLRHASQTGVGPNFDPRALRQLVAEAAHHHDPPRRTADLAPEVCGLGSVTATRPVRMPGFSQL
jgi:hypothetical protein